MHRQHKGSSLFSQAEWLGLQWPLCLSLLEEGKIQTDPLITHRLGFSEHDILKGFDIAANRARTGAIKVMFSW